MRDSVRLVEVGPRDGLQNIREVVPTATKVQLIKRLHDAGLNSIEVTSIVSPKAIPQLADREILLTNATVTGLLSEDKIRLPVLVPNVRGLETAIKHGVKEVAVFVSASEGFSRANINCSVREGLDRARHVAEKALASGMEVRGYISCIFADPYDGTTSEQSVLNCVNELLAMGCYEISLGDTLGVGVASDVYRLLSSLAKGGISMGRLAGHFHDTYGQAVSNVWQAYQCGVRVFDSSVSGLGGCPFAPGAKGNVATEDLVYLFHQAGVDTGVNLEELVNTGVWISSQLSKVNDSRAGAALYTKSVKKQKLSSIQSSVPLAWQLVKSGEGIEQYRSGVNVKLVLNRPRNGNALSTALVDEMTAFFENAKNDVSITRVVIVGRGKFFCTGMDLGKSSTSVGKDTDRSNTQFERLIRLLEAISNAPQVTIACLNGPAYGGGVGLAFACDIRFAVEMAQVTLSEVRLGLCPATISKYVAREWGPALAREAMLSGRAVSAREMHSHGLVSRVAASQAELNLHVDNYLIELRQCAPKASSWCKELIRLSTVDNGGPEQAKGIQAIFEQMMQPGAEGDIGVKHFQKSQTRTPMDWDALPKARARL